jgi:hypothetical protein
MIEKRIPKIKGEEAFEPDEIPDMNRLVEPVQMEHSVVGFDRDTTAHRARLD